MRFVVVATMPVRPPVANLFSRRPTFLNPSVAIPFFQSSIDLR